MTNDARPAPPADGSGSPLAAYYLADRWHSLISGLVIELSQYDEPEPIAARVREVGAELARQIARDIGLEPPGLATEPTPEALVRWFALAPKWRLTYTGLADAGLAYVAYKLAPSGPRAAELMAPTALGALRLAHDYELASRKDARE